MRVSRTTGSQSSLREANRTPGGRHRQGVRRVDAGRADRRHRALRRHGVDDRQGSSPPPASSTPGRRREAGGVPRWSRCRRRPGSPPACTSGRDTSGCCSATSPYTTLAATSMPIPFDEPADTGLDRITLMLAEMVEGVGRSMSELVGRRDRVPRPGRQHRDDLVRGLMPGWEGEQLGRRRRQAARLRRPHRQRRQPRSTGGDDARCIAGRGGQSCGSRCPTASAPVW